MAESPRLYDPERNAGSEIYLSIAIRHGTSRELATAWTKSFVPAKWDVAPFYDAAVSTSALDVRPDFRYAVWPSPLFFASADRAAAYSGATIG